MRGKTGRNIGRGLVLGDDGGPREGAAGRQRLAAIDGTSVVRPLRPSNTGRLPTGTGCGTAGAAPCFSGSLASVETWTDQLRISMAALGMWRSNSTA